MKAIYLLLLSLALLVINTHAQTTPQPKAQSLWPDGAPGAKGATPEDTPSIQLYAAPADKATGAAIVVCPGGGYAHLAPHEGHDVAVWLNSIGVTAVVLKYRLGPTYQHPAMLDDAQRAIRTVRAEAAEWKVDPARVGIMGFSAGGHLASSAGTHFDDGKSDATDPIEKMSSRPDVMILCYPVITMTDPFAHKGSRQNLLGKTPSLELIDLMSSEKQVTEQTPPTFLFFTEDDAVVPLENGFDDGCSLTTKENPLRTAYLRTRPPRRWFGEDGSGAEHVAEAAGELAPYAQIRAMNQSLGTHAGRVRTQGFFRRKRCLKIWSA